ncbi:MAG TPA: glycerate kinase [Patescibacteria group bacterium]|nr:glycerate kinase [Patescibacteria group bacterium]
MVVIKNREELINNGKTQRDKRARELAIKSLESALKAADPRQIIESRLLLRDSVLRVDEYSFDLARFKSVYVVGGGKASGSMAEALEKVLGRRITAGFVNVLHGETNKTSIIKLHGANHPVPDEAGVEGTRKMLDLVEAATADDLVICLISGGGSSMMPLPRGGISLSDKREITDLLLKSGATITEINTVRKHISDFKGGWLAKKAYPATVLNLILSDVMGDPLDFIASGPTVPDSTTFHDAVSVLRKYDLWARGPTSVTKVLSDGEKGLIPETPKASDEAFKRVHNVVVGNNRLVSQAACTEFKSAGLNTLLLTSMIEGEARHVGTVLSSIAREVYVSDNPVHKPGAVVAGGETTVTVTGKGKGGRNQEVALAAAMKLGDLDGVAVASLTTDGVDGPTDAAGAIVDGRTLAKAKRMGLSPEKFLAANDSYNFFSKISDLIFTGPTGTNVNDISLIVIL